MFHRRRAGYGAPVDTASETPGRGPLPAAPTIGLAALAFAAALLVLSFVAGLHTVTGRLPPQRPWWFAVALGAEVASFTGYVLCYRAVSRVRGGRELGLRQAIRLVALGFGAFLAKGGGALDADAFGESGEARVMTLDALEHAPLAPAAWAASVVLLVRGGHTPGLDFTIPWALLVPVGAVLAFVGVRHRARFEGRSGWRGWLGRMLEGLSLLFALAAGWREHWPAFAGSAVYWAGDLICLGACLAPFHATPALAGIIIAHAEGYVLTRRTLPLAGAGIVELIMPLTLNACGAPLSGAILGVLAYRVINLWLPLIPALAARRVR